jgi:hypothetical protein
MTARQRDLLLAIDAGEVSANFSTRGESFYRWKGLGDITTAVRKLLDARWVTRPARSFGSFCPIVLVLTGAGREALRAAEATKASG